MLRSVVWRYCTNCGASRSSRSFLVCMLHIPVLVLLLVDSRYSSIECKCGVLVWSLLPLLFGEIDRLYEVWITPYLIQPGFTISLLMEHDHPYSSGLGQCCL